MNKNLASLPVGESTREPDVEPDTTIPHTSQELGEIFGKVFKPAKPEPELGLGESREPLPTAIQRHSVTGQVMIKSALPSVPAEIESQSSIEEDILAVIRLVRMRPTQLMEMMRKYTYTEIQDALQTLITKHVVILSSDRYLDAKLIEGLADSTRTQEKP